MRSEGKCSQQMRPLPLAVFHLGNHTFHLTPCGSSGIYSIPNPRHGCKASFGQWVFIKPLVMVIGSRTDTSKLQSYVGTIKRLTSSFFDTWVLESDWKLLQVILPAHGKICLTPKGKVKQKEEWNMTFLDNMLNLWIQSCLQLTVLGHLHEPINST